MSASEVYRASVDALSRRETQEVRTSLHLSASSRTVSISARRGDAYRTVSISARREEERCL